MPPTKRPKRNTGPWSSLRVLNASSPIITTDVHAFLVTAISGWDSENNAYTEIEKRSIIDSLPLAYRKYELDQAGRLKCPLSIDFVLDDPYVKAEVQKFKNDVGEGYYEKSWQNQAKRAMQERQEGKFDAYLRERTEEAFGGPGLDGQDDIVDDLVDADMYSSDGEWSETKIVKARGSGNGKHPVQSRILQPKRKI